MPFEMGGVAKHHAEGHIRGSQSTN